MGGGPVQGAVVRVAYVMSTSNRRDPKEANAPPCRQQGLSPPCPLPPPHPAGSKASSGGASEEDGGGTGEQEESQGYSAAYARLANAARAERPVLAEIPDPGQYLQAALARAGGGR